MADRTKSEDPSFDVIQHTCSTFSTMSINKTLTHSSTKTDDGDDDDDDEKNEKSFEAIQELIQVGKVDILKLDQCKIYLKNHGLTTVGKKDTLILRIKDHIGSTKVDDDDDDIEVDEEVDFVVPKLDEKDQKSYEAVQKLIQAGKVDKLKVDQCKIYLKKHGLRMAGNKNTLVQRIKEHIDILDGGGERKYLSSSFVLNCKGDACTGDIVMFEQNVYEMFNVASRSATGPPCGTRTVAGRIIKESYGTAKQQHTFTIEVLWSKGEKPLPPLHPLLIKGRNLYRIKTMRQKWEDEEERQKILSEKHARGAVARSTREAHLLSKSKRGPSGRSKPGYDKMGPILQHLPHQEICKCRKEQKENHFILQHPNHVQLQQGWNENKNHHKDNHFHGNDGRGPIIQHLPPVKMQQVWHANKNHQKDNHFHGNDKRVPILQLPPPVTGWHANKNQQEDNQQLPPVKLQKKHDNEANKPKENHFHRNYYFHPNGQRRSNDVFFNPHPSEKNQCYYQRRHPFTNINMEYSRMSQYGGRRHPSNYMGESSRIPYGRKHHLTTEG